jgi:hypothetical protein
MTDTIIVAPHADDEIIGVYSLLADEKTKPIIMYTEDMSNKRKEETLKLREVCNIKAQLFLKNISGLLLKKENTFYFPDPINETHPAHRAQGHNGEILAREGYDVIFYSTEMNVPWKHEVKDVLGKETMMNTVYPSQSILWLYEKKFILFEAYYKWIF